MTDRACSAKSLAVETADEAARFIGSGLFIGVTPARAQATELLQRGLGAALFLDVDGTLVGIAPTPSEVFVEDGLTAALMKLEHRLGGALALNTGRAIKDIDNILEPHKFAISGAHGAEIRPCHGEPVETMAAPMPKPVFAELRSIAMAGRGLIAEDKGSVVTIHFRQNPDAENGLRRALQDVVLRHGPGLELRPGRKIFEIAFTSHSKATALRYLMETPLFRGRRPVMLGDDVADEEAFIAARGMGGVGLAVAGEYFANSTADFAGPRDVNGWLSEIAGSPVSPL